MKARRALVLLGGLCAWLSAARAEPAVMLREYSAQITRGHYVLGRRLVKVGEVVMIQAIKGASAEVTTAENDRLLVLLADLRSLPEPASPTPEARPLPSPGPPAAPASKAALASSPKPAPFLVLKPAADGSPAPAVNPATAPKADAEIKDAEGPIAERREIKVRCAHLTKKGTQCTRMTASPNGLCWQHGGD